MDEERDWLPGLTISLDPDAIEDYEFDFNTWLRGETLSNVELVYENCTASQRGALVEGVSVIRVEAVELDAFVTVRPVSNTGRRNDFTIKFKPVNT